MDYYVFLGRMKLYFRQLIVVEEILLGDRWSMYPLNEEEEIVSTHENDKDSMQKNDSKCE